MHKRYIANWKGGSVKVDDVYVGSMPGTTVVNIRVFEKRMVLLAC